MGVPLQCWGLPRGKRRGHPLSLLRALIKQVHFWRESWRCLWGKLALCIKALPGECYQRCIEGEASSSRRPNKVFWFSVTSGDPSFSYLVLSAPPLLHRDCQERAQFHLYVCVYMYIYVSPGLFWPELRHLAFGPLHLAERRTKSELAERDGYVLVLCGTDLTMSTVRTAARAVTWSDFSKLTCNSEALRKPCVSWGMSCWLSQCIISLLALRSLQPCVDSMRLFLLVLCFFITVPWKSTRGRRRLEVGLVASSHRNSPASGKGRGDACGIGQGEGEKRQTAQS